MDYEKNEANRNDIKTPLCILTSALGIIMWVTLSDERQEGDGGGEYLSGYRSTDNLKTQKW